MSRLLKILRFLSLSVLLVVFPLTGIAQEKIFGEDTLKALYSYKFALFTDWPEIKLNDSHTTIEFCIIGRNPFGQTALEAIEGKPVKDKRLHVEVYSNGVLSEESLQNCHVVFISTSETQRLPALLNSLQPFPILTVSDIPGFSNRGGMVTFIKSGDHIQFEINPDAIKQAELSISSKIIELAKLVKTTKEGT
ncbi:MAG: YfiR family protein [Methylococcaceae bacterium]|nr:YfiR family protein [Methylococcaceae bacterium]